MVVNAYVGSPYKLVFPLLSSGYLEIDYDKTVTQIEGTSGTVGGSGDDTNTPTASTISDTRNIQMWNHTGPFSLECIVTPYDVNGSAKYKDDNNNNTEVGILDSTKTPPYPSDFNSNRATTYESTSILGTSNSALHTASPLKLMIFHNTNLQLYLENTTKNSYNQPAEYKIVAKFKRTGTNTFQTLETDTVIKAEHKLTGYYDSYGYYDGISTSYTNIGGADIAGQGGSNLTLGLGTPMNVYRLAKGTELFDSNLNSLGVIDGINYSNGVLTMSQPQTTSQSKVYIHQKKEALYLEQMYKISFTYLPNAAEIYLNNNLVASMSHTESTVVIHPSDIRICGSGTTSEQFYGELYEIALHKGNSINTTTQKTLSPSYSNIFFYFRFGE
tara:strand:+ start:3077 stop:4234 length:1158 start_codon:yes stop_codon:yes gene_type:complete